jgi:hypothetical protein
MTERSDGVTDARIQGGKVIARGFKVSDFRLMADETEPENGSEIMQSVDRWNRKTSHI